MLLAVSFTFISCAQKLTEEQVLAKQEALKIKEETILEESQELSDLIKRYKSSLPNVPNIDRPKIPNLPPFKKIGSRTERLVALSPQQSIRWIQAMGYKVTINERVQFIEGHNSQSYRAPGKKPVKLPDDFDPYGNSGIIITGISYRSKPELFLIYDQFRNPRVITYEEY